MNMMLKQVRALSAINILLEHVRVLNTGNILIVLIYYFKGIF